MHSTAVRHITFFTLLTVCISLTVIAFGHLLQLILQLHHLLPTYIVLLSFIAGLITYLLYYQHRQQIAKHIARLYNPNYTTVHVPLIHIPLLITTTLLSHLFGASVGREGVAVQIGGTFGGYFSRKKKQWDIRIPSRAIITSSMAIGFAALFGMPLTATFFAIEISKLYKVCHIKWFSLPLIGSFIASQLSVRLNLSHMHFHIQVPPLTPSFLFSLIALLILLTLATTLYLYIHHHLASFLSTYIPSQLVQITLGAFILSLLLFCLQLNALTGLGTNLIQYSFIDQGKITLLLPFLKICFTLSFLAIGFKGGEVTPIFAIGAMLGALSASLFQLPSPLFAIIGLAAFFGATTKTYIAPLFLAVETTSLLALPFLLPVIIILHFTTPKTGIYQKKKDA